MSLRQSVLCDIAIRETNNRVRRVDLRVLFRNLLLFENVVLKSVALQEVPILASAFKGDGLKQLIDSAVLRFSVEDSALVTEAKLNGTRSLPFFQFSFGKATLQNADEKLRKHLKGLESVPGLGRADRLSLEDSTWSKLIRTPSNFFPNITSQSEEDLRTNKPIVSLVINKWVRKKFGDNAPTCSVKVTEVEPRVFYLENNLENQLGISQQEAHEILVTGVLSIAEINHRLEDMSAHSAITGFAEDEAPLLFSKLSGFLTTQNPGILTKQLARIETILGLPEISPEEPVNVENLMKARDSSELRDFQAWLYKFEGKDDKEVEDLVRAVGLRIGSMLRSAPGKAMRFAATTALGLIPGAGLVLGPVSGAIDTFVLGEMLPSSGVFAFLTKTYPSLFK